MEFYFFLIILSFKTYINAACHASFLVTNNISFNG